MANPYQIPVFPPWATEANYPAGVNPWNGLPTKLPPLPDYFIPSTPQHKVPPPAQWFNYLFNAASATAWYANGAAQSVAALNWQAWTSVNVFSAWTNCKVLALAWLPLSTYWMAAVYNTTTGQIVPYTHTTPAEALWTSVGAAVTVTPQHNAAPNQAFVALSPDPTTAGKAWLAVVTNATTCDVWTYFSGAFTAQTTLTVAHGQATVVMHTFGSRVIIGIGSAHAGEGELWIQPDNVGGLTGESVNLWRFCDNGTTVIALPASVVGATVIWTSTDGLHWTSQIITFLNAAQGESIFGACYTQDAYGPMVLVGINNTTLGHPRFVKSYLATFGTWQPQSQTTTMAPGIDLRANNGSLVVVTTTDANPTGFSVDGGLTWYPAYEAIMDTTGQSTGSQYQPPSIKSNGVSFAIFNSQSARLSYFEGLPAASM